MSTTLYDHFGNRVSVIRNPIIVVTCTPVDPNSAEANLNDDHKRLHDSALILWREAELLAVLGVANKFVADLHKAVAAVRARRIHIGADHVGENIGSSADDASGLIDRHFGQMLCRVLAFAHLLFLRSRIGRAA